MQTPSHQFEKNRSTHSRVVPLHNHDSTESFQHSNEINEVKKIKEVELNTQIEEYLKEQDFSSSSSNILAVKSLLFQLKKSNPTFSIYDLDVELLQATLQTNLQKSSWESAKTEVLSTKEYIISLQSEGLSNTSIVQRILSAEKQGVLSLPAIQKDKYTKFVQLADQDFGTDTKAVAQIINTVDINAPDAFDTVILQIFERDDISIATKEKIAFQFAIPMVQTGGQLKESLIQREKDLQNHEDLTVQLAQDLAITIARTETLVKKIAHLKMDLIKHLPINERLELEQRIEKLETQLGILKEQQKSQQNKQQQLGLQKPSSSIAIPNAAVQLIDGSISVKTTQLRHSIHFSLESTPEEITNHINTLQVYQLMQEYHLEDFIFNEAPLTVHDTISNHAVNITQHILAALNLANHNHILNFEEITRLREVLKDVVGENIAEENVAEQLANNGLLDSDSFVHDSFYKQLEYWRLTTI